jgi:hypothetical protein
MKNEIKGIVLDSGYSILDNKRAHIIADKWLLKEIKKKFGVTLDEKTFRKIILKVAKEYTRKYDGNVKMHKWENFYKLLFSRLGIKINSSDLTKIIKT